MPTNPLTTKLMATRMEGRGRIARILVVAGVLAASLVASPALAHGSAEHMMCTVRGASAERLELRTQDGKEVTVQLAPSTQIRRGAAAAQASDVHEGDRVVVHARKRDGHLVASEVKLAPEGR